MRLSAFILTIFLIIASNKSFSQGVAVGQWRDHLPYNRCNSVTEAKEKIYASTPYSVFYYDKEDNSINRLTKVTGLSDIGVNDINFHEGLNTLVIAYTNTNIDLIQNGSIINVSDIKRKQILGNKTIHKVKFIGNSAYLACGFGIVVLDLEKHEIRDTYYIGPEGSQINVYDISYSSHDSTIFASTEAGVYSAFFHSSNLANYQSWTLHTEISSSSEYNYTTYFNNLIFVNKNSGSSNSDTIYYFDGSSSR
jgi:hypothetical protein